ncbi:acetoin reductase family protein [Armillaria novae-zelandiae]|uniref:Acetoin reductase family protein n=1 Tax=Armillaria novae-zelandiae TaxID=153914 RepID=A0AA39PDF0_9AGAR|nr:acetoin reductase family protein [Armillaria novae-zelandiae]
MASTKGVALVTGSAQGLGRAIALRIAEDGYDVSINDLHSKTEELDALAAEIMAKGRRSCVVLGNISVENDVISIIDNTVHELGALNIMVANAGVCFVRSIMDTSTEDWNRIFTVNGLGTFLCYKYAAKQMMKQGHGGRIVGASSIAGKQGYGDLAAYSASKGAIRLFTQSAAREFGPYGITVNAYAPGKFHCSLTCSLVENAEHTSARPHLYRYAYQIGMSASGQLTEPADIASVVSYLVSSEARLITGR